MPSKKPARKRGKSAAKMMEAAKKEVAKVSVVKAEKLKITNVEARERTNQVTELFKTMGNMWWELGAAVKKCIDDRVPEALGINAHEWLTNCFGDSWLKVYRAHRIMKALSGVEMEKLQKITEGNAYVLARLPEKVRKSSEWIKEASALSNEKFREKAEKYIAKKTGIRDPMVKFPEAFGYSTLPKSLAKIVTSTLKLACKVNDFDWDQKEGRISATEAVFSEYFTTYQTGTRTRRDVHVVHENATPIEEEIYSPEERPEGDFEPEEEEEFRDK